MESFSKRFGSIFWLLAVTLLAFIAWELVTKRVSIGAQGVSLVAFVAGLGLWTLWRRGNPYIRSVFGRDKHLFRARVLWRLGRREAAISSLTRQLNRYPGNVQALLERSGLLLAAARPEEAIVDLDEVLAPYPDPDVLDRRGLLFLSIGAPRDGLADFETAAALCSSPPGWFAAIALVELRLLDRALAVLDTPNPKEDRPYFGAHRQWYRGEVLRMLGRSGEAREAFEEALARLESDPPVHTKGSAQHCLPDILGHLGRNSEALQLIASASTARDPVSPETHLLVALRRGDLKDVQALVKTIIPSSPGTIVSVLSDPEFTPLLATEPLRTLFVRAVRERDALLERVRVARARRVQPLRG